MANAQAQLHNPSTGYHLTVESDDKGEFRFTDVPANGMYELTITAPGFAPIKEPLEVRNSPIVLLHVLTMAEVTTSVSVTASTAVIDTDPSARVAAAMTLTPNRQVDIGLACNGAMATAAAPIRSCGGALTSMLLTLPATRTENNDHNPDRVKPRNLFDIAAGTDNLFDADPSQGSAPLHCHEPDR